jgi:prepilin-type processing-associated H-X9-DG protein
MNAFIEGGFYRQSWPGSWWFPDYYRYDKMSDILEPAPGQLCVFVDEHPDSINDGWMATAVNDRTFPYDRSFWIDLPASYHNGACGFCFADGHAEIHKWLEPSTRAKVEKRSHNFDFLTRGQHRDVDWMIGHSTAKRAGR